MNARHLKKILDSGKGSRERRRRAHILFLADESRPDGGRSDAEIAEVLEIGTATVERVCKRCVMEGLEAALERKVQVNRKKRLLDGDCEARLTMLACSKPRHGSNTATFPRNPSTGGSGPRTPASS